jgi:hypothetical protein
LSVTSTPLPHDVAASRPLTGVDTVAGGITNTLQPHHQHQRIQHEHQPGHGRERSESLKFSTHPSCKRRASTSVGLHLNRADKAVL